MDRTCHPADEAVLREGVSRYFPDANGATVEMKTCLFTNSPDEHFIIDRLPDAPQVALAAGCSGHAFKFSSVVGEILADLALDGGTKLNVELFRLDRPALGQGIHGGDSRCAFQHASHAVRNDDSFPSSSRRGAPD
jgi:sarcosine oxidase